MTIELMDEHSETVKCDRCEYVGAIRTFLPNPFGYNAIRCPKCYSTNNEYNKNYMTKVFGEKK